MKLIVAGSRSIQDTELVWQKISDFLSANKVTEFVNGGCPTGPDDDAKCYAEYHCIPTTFFMADWPKHGKAAGPIRNRQMAEYADHLLLIWDGESKGSLNMKYEMRKLGKQITEWIVGERTDNYEE